MHGLEVGQLSNHPRASMGIDLIVSLRSALTKPSLRWAANPTVLLSSIQWLRYPILMPKDYFRDSHLIQINPVNLRFTHEFQERNTCTMRQLSRG